MCIDILVLINLVFISLLILMNGGIELIFVKFGIVKLLFKFIVILYFGIELYLYEVIFLFIIVVEICNYNFKYFVDYYDYNKIY